MLILFRQKKVAVLPAMAARLPCVAGGEQFGGENRNLPY